MPLAHRFPQRHAGFSLIAVSILITVAALIFVSVLPGQEAGDVNIKIINNTKKLEKVEEAMRSFMAFQGRRPCPADGQYAEGTANFGARRAIPAPAPAARPPRRWGRTRERVMSSAARFPPSASACRMNMPMTNSDGASHT